jgi:hypothetical protein
MEETVVHVYRLSQKYTVTSCVMSINKSKEIMFGNRQVKKKDTFKKTRDIVYHDIYFIGLDLHSRVFYLHHNSQMFDFSI